MKRSGAERRTSQASSRHLAAAVLSAALAHGAYAAFEPERVSVKPAIDPGPNVLANDQGWSGAGSIHVYGQNDLAYKGNIPTGLLAQMIPAKDGKTLYVLSRYMKRIVYGPVEAVIQIVDLPTLTVTQEIAVPAKAVQSPDFAGLLGLSADGKLLYLQNATPATSVTVVDLDAAKVASEVPTPGCYAIFPARKGHKLTTACASGQLQTISIDGDGYDSHLSEKLFDVDTSPVYITPLRRTNGDLVLTTFTGRLLLVDDTGDTATLKDTIDVTEGIGGNWAPGGYQPVAYNAGNDVVLLLMHSDAYEGSHKDPSEEIWAYSLSERKLVSRSEATGLIALTASAGETPILFGSNLDEGVIEQFKLADPTIFTFGKTFTFTRTASDQRVGGTQHLEAID